MSWWCFNECKNVTLKIERWMIVLGLEDMEGLLALQRYLSGSLNIRTVIMDFSMFKNRVGLPRNVGFDGFRI